MSRITTDLCVIGAGSGGLSLAAGAVQMGARVVLVEGGAMGGDCLNHGCVPSKALLAAARAAEAQRRPGVAGIAPVAPEIDYAAVMDHVAGAIAAIAPHDSQERFEGLGVRVIRAWGRFVAPDRVEAGEHVITARRFAIATGAHAAVPALEGLADVPYLTNETIFGLRERPAHLIVLGGGPVGVEMAQAHRRLGSEVTIIARSGLLSREDPEAAAAVAARLRAEGVRVVERVRIAQVGGPAEVRLADGQVIAGSHLLLALGRVPALARLNLEAAGIQAGEAGIVVDGRLRTSNRRVFALGDVAASGAGQFTHVAAYQAGIVLRQAVLGLPARARSGHLPRVTYSDPELAQIGLTEAEARARHGDRVTILRAGLDHNDRAITSGRTEGFVKVVALAGRPIGVTAVGAEAGEWIGPWALAMSRGLGLGAVASMVAPYPTLGEAGKRAASAYFSPQLFDNPWVKRLVRLVQRWLP